MIQVPEEFRPKHPSQYPEDNVNEFERWFYENWKPEDCRQMTYLPILWTGYFCKHKYGRDHRALRYLQSFINSLPGDRQYYSIIQYDSGPLIRLPKNVKMFAMSGPVVHYPLPLVCEPHRYKMDHGKTIFANFIGSLTHPIRRKIVSRLQNKAGYSISYKKKSLEQFCDILSRSVFTLCPRGFGETSFRIQEALQYGSIPVYISDKFIIPHNYDFNEYGVIIHANQVDRIHNILSAIPASEIERKRLNGKSVYKEMYSYSGVKKLILENV